MQNIVAQELVFHNLNNLVLRVLEIQGLLLILNLFRVIFIKGNCY